MRIGFVGPSYTARSTAVADEECINWFAETAETQGSVSPAKAYGGSTAQGLKNYYGTPGLNAFISNTVTPTGPVRGVLFAQLSQPAAFAAFAVIGNQFGYVTSLGIFLPIAAVANDGLSVSMVYNSIQIFLVSAGRAYCFTIASVTFTDVTAMLAGIPIKCEQSDGYFIAAFQNTNKFQISAILDGTTWPGAQVSAVNVFPENITSIIVNHRELWVMGSQHIQPYQNTGSLEIFDVIPGTLIEKGCIATFATIRLDNSVFVIDQDERGALSAWRSQGYTLTRISTHAVETDLATYPLASIQAMASYSYQDVGHLFWVLYIPGSSWSWVYDVVEGLWHKRASWNPITAQWGPHFSWNHMYAYGKHLVGDWNSGQIYDLNLSHLTDTLIYNSSPTPGVDILRLRRSPTVIDEMKRIYHSELVLDFDTGLGPQPPLLDGNGNPRPPQVMLRWSDDRGKTWSNQHILNCGFAGQYHARVIQRRLGQSRYRVYEMSVSDPIPWTLVDAYLRLGTAVNG